MIVIIISGAGTDTDSATINKSTPVTLRVQYV